MLDGLPVLDCTDHRGEVGPWVLAQLGADVIKVEPPGGSPARRAAPLIDRPDGPLSLQFAAYNGGKRTVELDPSSATDRATMLDLIATTRIVIDSGPPGMVARFGLDRAAVEAANPTIVSVLVTPFGADGPASDDAHSELTIAARGGPVRLQGTPDRAPLQISVPQVWRHAGVEAAAAAMVANHRAERVGAAQFVDLSAQAVMTWTMLNSMEAAAIQGHDFERAGATLHLAMTIPLRRACADGHVVLVPRGAAVGQLLSWMLEDGVVDPSWAEEDWSTYDHRIVGGEPVGIPHTEVIDALDRLCAGHTKRTLLERGREFGVTIAPINDTADLLAFDHLERRAFWRSIDLDGTGPEAGLGDGPIRFPGACVTVDGDRPADDQAAPRPVDGPPTFADRPTVAVRPDGPPPHADDTGRPFEGLLVADFSWIGVGPITAKALADHGATVVRVESANRIDALRLQVPFKDGVAGTDRSQFFASFNTSKLGLSVDLKNDGGLLLVRELVDRADVVIDSFTPGAMARLGLGPDEIRRTNPAVITVTTSLLGGGGPFSTMAGYGYHAAAIAGFFELVGWPDRPPDGPWLAYTDTIGPRFITTALLAAIDRRNRTGQGCHIEAAQLELALQLLAPELLDQQLTGTVARRLGNRARDLAPQGVYRCAGDDAWIAISVPDDAAWDRLRAALGDPPWAADAALATVEGRQAGHDAIDRELAAWTATRTEAEAERILLDAGVPAGVPNRSSDLLADPQYEHRGFYRSLDHAEVGPVPYAGHQYRIDGYDHGPRWAAPTLGQHTFEVLTEVLGFDVDRVAEIAATGCLE